MENKYTSKEIAEILNVSDKSVRRYLKFTEGSTLTKEEVFLLSLETLPKGENESENN